MVSGLARPRESRVAGHGYPRIGLQVDPVASDTVNMSYKHVRQKLQRAGTGASTVIGEAICGRVTLLLVTLSLVALAL